MPATELTKEENPQLEKIRRELRRKSLDQIKCLNPYEQERVVVWDGFRHVVPPKGEKVLYRYLALKYFRETIDWRIHQEEAEAAEKQNDKRQKRGNPPMTPQEREQFAIQYGLSTNNEQKRREIMQELYGGIAEEYGMDIPAPTEPARKDERTFEEKMLEAFEGEASTPTTVPAPEAITEQPKVNQKEIEDQKKKLIEETSDGKKGN